MRTSIARLGAALFLALAPRPAGAQQPYTILEDADVRRLMPVVAASGREGERRREAVDALLADHAAAQRFFEDARAGRVDLEAELRRHAPGASVPPGAAYDAACSRSTVMPGSSAGLTGTLMLAYALPASAGDGADAVAFYRRKGLRVSDRTPAATWLEAPDATTDSLLVGVGRVFRADDAAVGCRHLVGKPVVTLRLRSFGFSGNLRAAQPDVDGAVAGREQAMARAGVSDERFQELLAAAMIARQDAEEGMREQLDALARIPDLAPQAEARKKNVAWYLRNRAALEPALGAYLERLGR